MDGKAPAAIEPPGRVTELIAPALLPEAPPEAVGLEMRGMAASALHLHAAMPDGGLKNASRYAQAVTVAAHRPAFRFQGEQSGLQE